MDLQRTRTTTPDGRELLLYGAWSGHTDVVATQLAAPLLERRFDELRGEEVVYATARQDRTHLPDATLCPFCPAPDGDWSELSVAQFEIAVFENRFPAFTAEAGGGSCEVVVYTDSHEGSFATLPPERAEALMWVWRDRYAELGARPDVEYVMPFENRGVEVGVTLHHPHGQVYAFPFVPPVAAAERRADERRGRCTLCTWSNRRPPTGGDSCTKPMPPSRTCHTRLAGRTKCTP